MRDTKNLEAMIVKIDSPEFADAWRTVSESLLAYIQKGGNVANTVPETTPQGNDGMSTSDEVPSPASQPASPAKTVRNIRYANCPIRNSDGTYKFKNLKEEEQPESTYKITTYEDDTCEFELCNLKGEARQIFKDNKADRMPGAVGSSKGEITADNNIVNKTPGKGRVDGRSVIITGPLEVEFS